MFVQEHVKKGAFICLPFCFVRPGELLSVYPSVLSDLESFYLFTLLFCQTWRAFICLPFCFVRPGELLSVYPSVLSDLESFYLFTLLFCQTWRAFICLPFCFVRPGNALVLMLIKKEITHFLASLLNNSSINLFFSNPANCITSIFPFAYNLNKQLVSMSTVTGIIYFNFSINLHDLHVQIFQAISFIFTALLSCCFMSMEVRWPIRDGFLHCPGKSWKKIHMYYHTTGSRESGSVCVCGGGGGGGEWHGA